MRTLLSIILLCALLASCSKPQSGVLFQRGDTLTAAERAHLAETDPYLTNRIDFSALWVQSGLTQHVYLRDGDIGSLSRSAEVVVFDSDGRIADAYLVGHANQMPSSLMIVSMSPLRLRFSYRNGWAEEVVGRQMEEFAAGIQTTNK